MHQSGANVRPEGGQFDALRPVVGYNLDPSHAGPAFPGNRKKRRMGRLQMSVNH